MALTTTRKQDTPFKDGRVQIAGGTFLFQMMRFDEASDFGIDCGRISKLKVQRQGSDKDIIRYERAWEIEPKTKQAKAVLDWILRNFN